LNNYLNIIDCGIFCSWILPLEKWRAALPANLFYHQKNPHLIPEIFSEKITLPVKIVPWQALIGSKSKGS